MMFSWVAARRRRRFGFGTRRKKKLAMTLAAALASGSLLTTCQTRLKEAAVAGTKDLLFTLLSPTTFVDLLFSDADDTDE